MQVIEIYGGPVPFRIAGDDMASTTVVNAQHHKHLLLYAQEKMRIDRRHTYPQAQYIPERHRFAYAERWFFGTRPIWSVKVA